MEVEGVSAVTDVSSISDMVQTFPAVSASSIGCYTGPPVHIHVDASKPPRYHRARPVKLPLVTKVEEGIAANVTLGLWTPAEHSRWASGLVPVPKRNGDVRLCAYYSATVNPAIDDLPY